MVTWHPDIIAHLNSHGFNIESVDPYNFEQENTRYRFLRMSQPSRGNHNVDLQSYARRFRLYTGGFLWTQRSKWKHAVTPLIVDMLRPNWKRSVDRWVSLAVMTLAEASMEIDKEQSNERRRVEDRVTSARAALDGTGISVRDIATTFGFEWGGDNYSNVDKLGSLTIKPSPHLSLDEAIAKTARLIVFLQQENWIFPQPDDANMTPAQLLDPKIVYPNITTLKP